jgi:cell division control protein 45
MTSFGNSLVALHVTQLTHVKKRLSIIGLTDQYIHQRIHHQKYLLQSEILKEEVSRFNIPSGRGERDPLLDADLFGDDLNPSRRTNTNRVKGADDSSVICDEDFRLSLLRHWSLQESMYHSSYVAARLGIWREKGRRRLTNLLVKMG